jgi:hypothetical protein
VVPISSDLPIERIGSSTSVKVAQHSNGASNGSVQHRRSSTVSRGRLTRVSMDPSSAGALSFYNIDYFVGGTGTNSKTKSCSLPCIKREPVRQILYDVSGIFTTGMNAIMGKNKILFSE